MNWQSWRLLDLDKWEAVGDGEVPWFFETRNDAAIVKLLATPLEFAELFDDRLKKLIARPFELTPETARALGRLALPAEVLQRIFGMVQDVASAASLGLANTRLLAIGLKRIRALLLKETPCWIGDRLMCCGSSQKDADLPDGLLTDQETKASRLFRPSRISTKPKGGSGHPPAKENPDSYQLALEPTGSPAFKSLYDFSTAHFVRRDEPEDEPALAPTKATRKKPNPDLQARLHGRERALFATLTAPSCAAEGEPPRDWVLCNLTTREFVRHDAALALAKRTKADGPFTHGPVGLGQVLLAHVCWSSQVPEEGAYDGGDMHRGRWAGHRFEVAPRARMRPGAWTDVTEKMLEVIEEVWDFSADEDVEGGSWRIDWDGLGGGSEDGSEDGSGSESE